MLGIDDVDAGASADGADEDGRQQVGLARSRMAENADVGVRVMVLIKWIDEHRSSGRRIASDEQAAWLLQVRLVPGKEGDERARVEHALGLQSVGAARPGREVAAEHPERAGWQLTEHCSRRGFDLRRPE